jgi:hypothetical protein
MFQRIRVKLHVLLLMPVQVIFKQLLSLKWAERDLGQAWQSMRSTKRLRGCVQCCARHSNRARLQLDLCCLVHHLLGHACVQR